MVEESLTSHHAETPRLKLDTLVRLRWLSIAGQTLTVVVVHFWLGFLMPIGLCLGVIALSAWLNLVLKIRYPSSLRLRGGLATLLLGYDVLQLSALLFLTGGLQNPFAMLLVVPVMISATTLDPRLTIALGGLVFAAVTMLALVHLPLPWAGKPLELPLTYVAGVWFALVCGVVFTGNYAFRVAFESRQLAEALAATELVLAREQHLSALDGLAAAAAHQLGTPLATITLVAKELQRELVPGSPHADDVALLRSQAERCRDILGKLASLAVQPDQHLDRLPISHLIAEAAEPHQGGGITIGVKLTDRGGGEPIGRRNPGILYGVGNLLENAVDFANSAVEITAVWTDKSVSLVIADDGPGFANDVIDHIGEPYVTTRAPAADETAESAGGLGLGFFIAKTLLERSGARVELSNRLPPAHGAIVRIDWPRSAMDSGGLKGASGRRSEGEAGGEARAWRAPVTG